MIRSKQNAGVGVRSFMVQFMGTVMNIPVVRERERFRQGKCFGNLELCTDHVVLWVAHQL